MTSEIVVGLLGVAVTLNVAAIAALGWLINFVIRLDTGQTASRMRMAHDLALQARADHREMAARLDRIEDRLNAAQVVTYRPRRHHDE
jgi:hypothetical protein